MYQRIKEEYQDLENLTPKIHNFSEDQKKLYFSSALSSFTMNKNRYPDVLPLENTRVRLSPQNFEGSDFINANYVLGNYIACQAPILSTFSDFWRMIWEQGTSIIVMLTKLFEAGRTKAHMYWPNSFFKFGELTITKLEEHEFDFFVLRRFLLAKGDNSRIVFQLHFTAWPDQGVPSSTKGIRQLVKYVNMIRSPRDGPIVVHCSAGIGRTGSFIAIHHTISCLVQGQPEPNILELIYQMRTERIGMVQTEKQYEFIYQAIMDWKLSIHLSDGEEAVSLIDSSDLSSSLEGQQASLSLRSWSVPTFPLISVSDREEVTIIPDSFMCLSEVTSTKPVRSRDMNWRTASSDRVATVALSSS